MIATRTCIVGFIRRFFVLLVALTVVGAAHGEDASKAETATKEPLLLEKVTVTGARIEKDLFSTPMGMNVVDREKLLREQPRTAAESLRDEAGIWVQKTGHIGGAPIIRGMMGKQILLLVDGVRYNNLNAFSGPNSWMNTIDADDIERVEVIRGPGSVLYGTDALGGVVNIITKKNRRFSDTLEIHPRLTTRFASADRGKTERFELRGSSQRVNLLVGGTLKDIEDLRAGRGLGLQIPSSWKERNFDVFSSVKLSDRQFLDLSYQNFHRYDVTRFDRPGRLDTNDRMLYSAVYRRQGTSDLLSQVRLSAAFHDREDGRVDTKRIDRRFTNTETLQLNGQVTSLVAAQKLTYGAQFVHDTTDGWRKREKGITVTPNAKWDNFGVFLRDELTFADRVTLTPAVRWDTYKLDREKDPGNPSDVGVKQDTTALTGSVGVVVSLNEYVNLTGNLGRGFRAPNNRDYRSAPSEFTFGVSVPTTEPLDPETSTSFEAGIRVNHPRFQASVSGYYTIINNLLSSKPGTYLGLDWYDWNGDGVRDPDEDVFVQTNGDGEVVISGAELQTQVILGQGWSVLGTFSIIDGEDRSGDTADPLGRAYPTNGALKLLWREPDTGRYWGEFATRLVADFSASRIPESRLTRDPAYKVNPQDRESPLLSGDGSVPGYSIFTVRGGVQVTDWAEFTLAVENVGDRLYRNKDSRIDAPGINFVAAWTLRP